tara:strand:+ start:230 stop:871 length:642 start_codon:yes stop_codon:yes gene_type:complete
MQSLKNIRLYGAGRHSFIIQQLLKNNNIQITAVFDDNPKNHHRAFHEVLPGMNINILDFPFKGDPFIIGIGDNLQRSKIAKYLNGKFSIAVHNATTIDDTVIIEEGTVVYAGAVIQPNTIIGRHVIINTSASVDHDNIIHDFVHISPNAALCGLVEVGTGTHIGAGAVVIPKVKIGKWCTIGAGSVIIKDVPDYAVVVGNPGRVIKIKETVEI